MTQHMYEKWNLGFIYINYTANLAETKIRITLEVVCYGIG